jgi:hypothetical protein
MVTPLGHESRASFVPPQCYCGRPLHLAVHAPTLLVHSYIRRIPRKARRERRNSLHMMADSFKVVHEQRVQEQQHEGMGVLAAAALPVAADHPEEAALEENSAKSSAGTPAAARRPSDPSAAARPKTTEEKANDIAHDLCTAMEKSRMRPSELFAAWDPRATGELSKEIFVKEMKKLCSAFIQEATAG